MDNSLENFDSSTLNVNDRKTLSDFKERKKIFDTYLKDENINLFTCPSCGYPILCERGGYEICTICHWEDDGQDDVDANEVHGGPNSKISLTESRLKIGCILNDLVNNLKGSLNLSPKEVLQILEDRSAKINEFGKQILMNTDISDPVWKEYKKLKEDTLAHLIKRM